MLARTHLTFGFLIALLTKNFFPGNEVIFFGIVLFASLLPDIDSPNSRLGHKAGIFSRLINTFLGHRGIFHSLLMTLMFSYTLFYFFGVTYGIAMFLGYMSHLMADSLTKQGINLLAPFTELRLKGFIETGKLGEHFILILLLIIISIKLL